MAFSPRQVKSAVFTCLHFSNTYVLEKGAILPCIAWQAVEKTFFNSLLESDGGPVQRRSLLGAMCKYAPQTYPNHQAEFVVYSRDWLTKQYIDRHLMTEEPYLLIGTPAYNCQVHTDYVHTLLSLFREKIRYSVITLGNESLISRARNSLISKFNEMEVFTHLLFLDGDIFVDGAQIKKLLAHGKDVIGAPVALKGESKDGKKIYNISGPGDISEGLTTVNRVGTAVFMLSRSAVHALIEDAEQDGRVYPANPHRHGVQDSEKQFDVFQTGVVDGEYLSEDFWVCRRLRDLGFEIFVDFSVPTRHNGMAAF